MAANARGSRCGVSPTKLSAARTRRQRCPLGAFRTDPRHMTTILSAGLLVVSLIAIVGLAKILTPTVERGIAYLDVPKAAP
jgi:Ca2+/H+ antiporter